jgi:hypothetical protein
VNEIGGTLQAGRAPSVRHSRVSIARDKDGRRYPDTPPFHPPVPYPEYPFDPYTQERGTPNQHDNPGTHTYSVGNTVLRADTVISIAKLKTHKKAGVTLNLKNMIGIINEKAFIPHHRPGPPPYGDAYPSPPPRTYVVKRNMKRRTAQLLAGNPRLYAGIRGVVHRAVQALRLSRAAPTEWGDWYGNDTIRRTILDINRVLFYAHKSGTMRETRQRGTSAWWTVSLAWRERDRWGETRFPRGWCWRFSLPAPSCE